MIAKKDHKKLTPEIFRCSKELELNWLQVVEMYQKCCLYVLL